MLTKHFNEEFAKVCAETIASVLTESFETMDERSFVFESREAPDFTGMSQHDKEIATAVLNTRHGIARGSLTYSGEVKLLKRQIKGTFLEHANVTKTTIVKNPAFAWNYEKVKQARTQKILDTAGGGPLPEASIIKPFGRHFVTGLEDMILQSDTDPSKFYLRYYTNSSTKTSTTYFIDGQEASEEEIEAIKANLPKRKPTDNPPTVELREISLDKIVDYNL